MTFGRFGWLALIALSGNPRPAGTPGPTVVVDVHVVDGHNVAVSGADVSIVRGLNDIEAHGTTDDGGRRRLVVARASHPVQVVVRKIGFSRADQFIVPSHDTVTARIVMHPAPQALPTVTVQAQEDLQRKRFHIDADDIANSDRPIIDALDVVTKLRPDMIYPPQGNRGFDACGLFYVWVNGERIVFAPIDAGLAAKAGQQRRAALATPHLGASGLARVPLTVQSVLSTIHPEHIEEINYAGCNDFSVEKNYARNAVFVTLKPGVAFEPGTGSFVVDAVSYTNAQLADSSSVASDSFSTLSVSRATSYRSRLLGVYDSASGEPLAGVDVVDSASGTFATTSSTGTVVLAFLPEGVSTIKIRKPGYAELVMPVTISPRDTTPLTVVVSKP